MGTNNVRKLKKVQTAPEATPDDTIEFVERLKRQWVETIDALPDPFIIVGEDYTIRKANAAMARVAGKPVKFLIGSTCHKLFAGRNKPCENCRLLDAKSSADPTAYEIFNQQNERWYEVTSRRLVSDDPGNQGILQIYRDRTETRRLQYQLQQNEKLASIGQLAGGFAHEINNPLGGVLVFAQMLLREMDKSSSHYQDVVEIEHAAQRCKTIVDHLLNFARQRPINQKFELCDVHTAIESALKFASVGHNQGGRCTIDMNLDAEKTEVLGNPQHLIQIFLNLFTNALQAMKDGGTLSVHSRLGKAQDGESLFIEIEDDGMGIRPENLKKIFDPFFTTKEPGQGTGLGLSIVHGIIQDHGGTIEVESKVKHGTKFKIRLPIPDRQKGSGS